MLNQILLSDLKMFGLSEYEARAYLVLSMYGPSSASFISEHSKIPSSKIYDILNSLRFKGLLDACNTKPKRFKLIDPKYALTSILASKELMIEEMRIKTKNLLEKLNPPQNSIKSEIWHSRGKRPFYDKACEILNKTKEHAIATTKDFSRYPFLDYEFLDATKRGVKIRILCTSNLTDDAISRATWYVKNGADIRVLPMKTSPILGIIDDSEVVFKINSQVDCDFMWSNNENLISIMKNYFENLWLKASPIQQCLSVLQEN
ncbi:MAG: hypothetical protein KJ697_03040 [Nanoarchaeota archaeon]|nr:hypothetical protein [Nanoarchaeota archaeon]